MPCPKLHHMLKSSGAALLRLQRFAALSISGSIFLPPARSNKRKILVFIHPAHINSPTEGKLSCDKIEPYSSFLEEDFQVLKFIIPPLEKRNVNYNYFSLNKQYVFCALKKAIWWREHISISSLLYNRLLRRFKPICVLTIGVHPDLIKSCLSFSVPYIEVQHGWISKDYLRWLYKPNCSPDYFLAWSHHYAQQFTPAIEKDSPVAVAIGVPLVYSKSFQSELRNKGRNILFALSGEVPESIDPFGCINQEDFAFLSSLISEYGVNIVKLRCHPVVASKTNFDLIENWFRSKWTELQISNPHRVGLLDDLNLTKLLIGPATSLSIEAATMGIPSHLRLIENINYNYDGGLLDNSHSYIDPALVSKGYIYLSKNYSMETVKNLMGQNFTLPDWDSDNIEVYKRNLRQFMDNLDR